jgi:hypothetical protein
MGIKVIVMRYHIGQGVIVGEKACLTNRHRNGNIALAINAIVEWYNSK